jgi:hypothetical protein
MRTGTKHFVPVLWIRIGFSADVDPDPAFYLYADLNPDPGQTLKSQKFEFLHWKYTKVGKVIGQNTHLRRYGTKPFWNARNEFYFLTFVNFLARGFGSGSAFPKRIRIHCRKKNADPCGSGSAILLGTRKISQLFYK